MTQPNLYEAGKVSRLQPAASVFAVGRLVASAFVLCLQLSLIFWPVAIRLAWRLNADAGRQILLTDIATAYQPSERCDSAPRKRFRSVATA